MLPPGERHPAPGFFAIVSLRDGPARIDSTLLALWTVCFAIAAGGIALIWRAVRLWRPFG